MYDDYKYRGWYWLGLCVMSVLAIIVNLVIWAFFPKEGVSYFPAILLYFVIPLVGWRLYIRARRQSRETWNHQHGELNKREYEIKGQAAQFSLKIYTIILYAGAAFVTNITAKIVAYAALALGGIIYFTVDYMFDKKFNPLSEPEDTTDTPSKP